MIYYAHSKRRGKGWPCGLQNEDMSFIKRTAEAFQRHFSIAVLVVLMLLAVLLGVLNNFRVDEEKRVDWFGGPMVVSEGEEDMP